MYKWESMIMSKQKFYAIKKGKGVENKIVSTWEECKSLVEGYHSEFKSFKTEEDALKYLGIKSKRNKKNKKASKKSDSGIVNLNIQSKDNKSNSFKVQISDELYNDFIEKCIEKHLSKDMILAFIINQWTYYDE